MNSNKQFVDSSRSFVRRSGFTLLEAMVVVAVLSLLVSVLIPTVMKARRMAQVLVCPISYIAADNSVWICDVSGKTHLKVSYERALYGPWIRWSPDGRRLCFMTGGNSAVAVADPITMQTKVIDFALENPIWIDDDTLFGTLFTGTNDLYRVSWRTGDIIFQRDLAGSGVPYGELTMEHVPSLNGGFVLCEDDCVNSPTMDVVERSRQWNLERVIWEDDSNNIEDRGVRVSRNGDWIAWTRGRGAGHSGPYYVAVKHTFSNGRPTMLGGEYDSAAFCAWTRHNDMLVVLTRNNVRKLAIMDRHGKVKRIIPTPHGLYNHPYGFATYRRHGP